MTIPTQHPAPTCPYCGKPAVLADSECVYNRSYGLIWICFADKAYVGCHKGTHRPKGGLANKELREWRIKAHGVFDPLWQAKARKRQAGDMGKSGKPGRGQHYKPAYARISGYKWLAAEMGITMDECHIGMMNIEQCQRVIALCSKFYHQPERASQ